MVRFGVSNFTRRWRAGGMACSPVDVPRREAAIAQALANKLEQRAKDRAEAAAKARAENEAFTKEFLNKAREVFELIDKDDSGSLAIDEITTAFKSDKVVKDFLKTCGDETLMFLLQPKRLDHALRELDTDGSGEVDIDECTARRPTCQIDATRVHWLIRAQGRRRSAGACRSASSSSPTSASAASGPRPRRTRPFRPNSCSPRARSS